VEGEWGKKQLKNKLILIANIYVPLLDKTQHG
jgi:hypothetical protein